MLAHPEAQQESLDRSHALYVASFVGRMAGRYDEARVWAEEGLRIAQKYGDTLAIWDARFQLGNALLGLDRVAALEHLVEVLAIAREVGDSRRLAFASTALGEAYAMMGQLELAEPHYIEALGFYRAQGDPGGIALGLFNLSRISIACGALARAVEFLREAATVAMSSATISAVHVQAILQFCTGLAAHRADWPLAARFYGAADAHQEHSGYRREPPDEEFLAQNVASTREALGAPAFDAGVAGGRAMGYEAALTEACAWLKTLPGEDIQCDQR